MNLGKDRRQLLGVLALDGGRNVEHRHLHVLERSVAQEAVAKVDEALQRGGVVVPAQLLELLVDLQRLAERQGALVAHLLAANVEAQQRVVGGEAVEEGREVIAQRHGAIASQHEGLERALARDEVDEVVDGGLARLGGLGREVAANVEHLERLVAREARGHERHAVVAELVVGDVERDDVARVRVEVGDERRAAGAELVVGDVELEVLEVDVLPDGAQHVLEQLDGDGGRGEVEHLERVARLQEGRHGLDGLGRELVARDVERRDAGGAADHGRQHDVEVGVGEREIELLERVRVGEELRHGRRALGAEVVARQRQDRERRRAVRVLAQPGAERLQRRLVEAARREVQPHDAVAHRADKVGERLHALLVERVVRQIDRVDGVVAVGRQRVRERRQAVAVHADARQHHLGDGLVLAEHGRNVGDRLLVEHHLARHDRREPRVVVQRTDQRRQLGRRHWLLELEQIELGDVVARIEIVDVPANVLAYRRAIKVAQRLVRGREAATDLFALGEFNQTIERERERERANKPRVSVHIVLRACTTARGR